MKYQCRFLQYAVTACLISCAGAATLSLDPLSQSAQPGESFTLSLRVSGLGELSPPSLGAFDLEMNYDPSHAQLDSVAFGDPTLGDFLAPVQPSLSGSIANSGVLNLFSVSLDSPSELDGIQPGQFTLARLNFTALAEGETLFELNNVVLSDANGEALTVDALLNATLRIVPGHTVPESAPNWLFVLAMGALAGTHARLRRRSETPF